MTLDLVIRNGTIVDGSGMGRYRADVGVADGRIVEIGRIRAPAQRTINADGLIVAPGFLAQGTDTAWVVSAMATIRATPATEHDAEALRKALACTLAREAPLTFHQAELQLTVTFDPGSRPSGPASIYFADLELTPAACNEK